MSIITIIFILYVLVIIIADGNSSRIGFSLSQSTTSSFRNGPIFNLSPVSSRKLMTKRRALSKTRINALYPESIFNSVSEIPPDYVYVPPEVTLIHYDHKNALSLTLSYINKRKSNTTGWA